MDNWFWLEASGSYLNPSALALTTATAYRSLQRAFNGSWPQPRFLAHLDHASFRRHKIRVFAMDTT